MAEQHNISANELTFHVDASILVQLGEQLVTRRSTALSELIKNAYDADATEVIVTLQKVKELGGTIVVEDNGQGMTVEDISLYWMRLATNNKKNALLSSKYGRTRAGQKGIGRFAVRRLSNVLILETVALDRGKKMKTVIEFDWKKSFQPGETLTQIPVKYFTEEVADSAPTGVRLQLADAKDIWTQEDVAELRRDLSSLVNPFPNTPMPDLSDQSRNDPGFKLLLIASEFPEAEGELSESFLSTAWGVLRGEVTGQGKANYSLRIRNPEEEVELRPENESFLHLNGIKFTIYFFVYRASYFEDDYLGTRDAMRVGREQGGVRIYLDQFRVFPYGEMGDDWLALDEVRARRTARFVQTDDLTDFERSLGQDRPELLTPGNNQLFGEVKISQQSHPQFEITASREGFVDNEAFRQLKRFVQIGLWWMTLQYARISLEARARRREDRFISRLIPISERLDEVRVSIESSVRIPIQERQELVSTIQLLQQEAQIQEEQNIDDITMLRVLSATGTVVSMMNHQLRSMLSGLHSVSVDLSELRPFVVQSAMKRYEKILQRLQLWRKSVEDQVSQLGFLLGEKARKEQVRSLIRAVVDDVALPLGVYMKDNGIDFENNVPSNLRTPPMYEAEIYTVLLHIFTNALKAVRDEPVRRVGFSAIQRSDGVHIFIMDTGKGIPLSDREIVFKPFRTTTGTPDPVFGTGTGLGLKIVRDILQNYNGTVNFVDAPSPWKTCLEITLRN